MENLALFHTNDNVSTNLCNTINDAYTYIFISVSLMIPRPETYTTTSFFEINTQESHWSTHLELQLHEFTS